MKTVDKAMTVLGQFSIEQTEIGLTELSKMAGLDKAATRRLLLALSKHGYIEQVSETRKYRLGQGFLTLARIREATVPLAQAAQEVCDWLAAETDETAHAGVPGADGITTIGYCLPNRGNVINIIPSQVLPFHASATGLAWLAFSSPNVQARVLAMPRQSHTPHTVTDEAELKSILEDTRLKGYARSENALEAGVSSLAMPFYLDGAEPAGAIAIAAPLSRMEDGRADAFTPLLREAVRKLEAALKGAV
jgi:DNA-binding IclR family transcriptional regulator